MADERDRPQGNGEPTAAETDSGPVTGPKADEIEPKYQPEPVMEETSPEATSDEPAPGSEGKEKPREKAEHEAGPGDSSGPRSSEGTAA